ncbi:MAG: putative metal-binding motif-containing protein, partial [bacterium]
MAPSQQFCTATRPCGFALVGGDCDDANANRNPGLTEVCNGVDDDCVGGVDNGLVFNTY